MADDQQIEEDKSPMTVSVLLWPSQVRRLDALGERTDRPRSWHVRRAVANYLEVVDPSTPPEGERDDR